MAFDNWDIARRWVMFNTGTTPRTVRYKDQLSNNSMSFRGRDLFSYRTTIARWHDNYVLVTGTAPLSNSTSRHRRIAESVLYRTPHFRVPCLDYDSAEQTMHMHNVAHLMAGFEAECKRLVRNFKSGEGRMPYWMQDSLVRQYAEVTAYKDLTRVEIDVPAVSDIIASVTRGRIEKWLAYTDPKAVEKRERAAARKAAKAALGLEDAA